MLKEQATKRVFVVDDERVISTTLGLILKHSGFDSTSYFDPLQLLADCKTQAPDAVVSDVVMPQMTGIDLALKMGELYPACKVILLSGQAATSELLQEARMKGHEFDVLAKPVAPPTLVEHVRKALS